MLLNVLEYYIPLYQDTNKYINSPLAIKYVIHFFPSVKHYAYKLAMNLVSNEKGLESLQNMPFSH